METAVRPAQNGRGRKRRWPAEQELAVLQAWIEHYNREAPHSALGMRSPAEFYAGGIVKNKKRPVPN